MDWVVDLSQKIGTLMNTEGIMAMQEVFHAKDAFDFVDHQLQTVGNSIENQFQTVSTNIESQLQAIRANIQQYCSNVLLDEPKLVVSGNENIETTALKSSACTLDMSGEEEPNLADVENENINSAAQEFSMLTTEPTTFKKSHCMDLFGKEIPVIADSGNSADTASDMDTPTPDMFAEESIRQKYVHHVLCAGPADIKDDIVIRGNDKKPTLDEICTLMDSNNNNQCSLCFKKLKSDPEKKITCEACAVKVKSSDQQEHDEPAPESEVLNNELNSEDESFEIAELDCDSEWEII